LRGLTKRASQRFTAKTFLDQKGRRFRAHQYDAERVVGWDFEHVLLLVN
jgi:hypothetical protein